MPSDYYARAISIGYKAKLGQPVDQLAQQWLVDYPTASNYRDALTIYRDLNKLDADVDLDILGETTSDGDDRMIELLDGAATAVLLDESPSVPGRYSFVHALVRSSLGEGFSLTRRAAIHRRIGEAIEHLRVDRVELVGPVEAHDGGDVAVVVEREVLDEHRWFRHVLLPLGRSDRGDDLVLLDLARRGGRQRIEHLEPLRQLVGREPDGAPRAAGRGSRRAPSSPRPPSAARR